MKSKTKLIIVVIGIILTFYIILFLVLFNTRSAKNEISNTENNQTVEKPINNIKDDNNYYVSIFSIINKYHVARDNNNKEELISYLSNNYIKENGLELTELLETDPIYYYPNNIIYKKYNGKTFAFVSGATFFTDFYYDTIEKVSDLKYLVVLLDGHFNIEPLELNDDLKIISENFDYNNFEFKSNLKNEYSDDFESFELYDIYLQYYRNSIVADPNTAYNLSSDNIKNKYSGFDDFSSRSYNLANQIIGAAIKCDKEDNNVTSCIVSNGAKVYFVEKGLLDFTIDIE